MGAARQCIEMNFRDNHADTDADKPELDLINQGAVTQLSTSRHTLAPPEVVPATVRLRRPRSNLSPSRRRGVVFTNTPALHVSHLLEKSPVKSRGSEESDSNRARYVQQAFDDLIGVTSGLHSMNRRVLGELDTNTRSSQRSILPQIPEMGKRSDKRKAAKESECRYEDERHGFLLASLPARLEPKKPGICAQSEEPPVLESVESKSVLPEDNLHPLRLHSRVMYLTERPEDEPVPDDLMNSAEEGVEKETVTEVGSRDIAKDEPKSRRTKRAAASKRSAAYQAMVENKRRNLEKDFAVPRSKGI